MHVSQSARFCHAFLATNELRLLGELHAEDYAQGDQRTKNARHQNDGQCCVIDEVDAPLLPAQLRLDVGKVEQHRVLVAERTEENDSKRERASAGKVVVVHARIWLRLHLNEEED